MDENLHWMLRYIQGYHTPSDLCTASSFCEVGQNFEKTIVIVDALDECVEERRKAIELINAIVKTPRVKMFATYGEKEDVLVSTEIPRGRNIEMQPNMVADDIKSFIAGQVKKLRQREDGENLYLDDDSLEALLLVPWLVNPREGESPENMSSYTYANLMKRHLAFYGLLSN